MRNEREMLGLIMRTAEEDDRIRVVIMNGSRASPSSPEDIFRDYDIVYLVTEVGPFANNPDWIRRFGKLMILQMPDLMSDAPPEPGIGFTYLMQFSDGNRIDLTLFPASRRGELEKDSQSIILLDKDGLVPAFPPPSDSGYLPKPPTAKAFADCCNEFWWLGPYIAKGLWRRQITYAKETFEIWVRRELMKMLVWYAGMRTDFSRMPGKCGKYLEGMLEPGLWDLFMKTYSDSDYDRTWDALFTACELFGTVALRVAGRFRFEYCADEEKNVTAHLRYVRDLPPDAEDMY